MKKQYDFIDLNYRPKDDLVCLFKVIPAKREHFRKAVNSVALESSIGTWTKVDRGKEYVEKLKAIVFSIQGDYVKIAYPKELFEYDNVPNILSSVAGNIFGMKAVKAIRLEDVSFPKQILNSFSETQ